jgi:hypothetical protein
MKISIDSRDLKDLFKDIESLKPDLLTRAHKFFVAHTPILTGNARRNTVKTDDAIIANYPYAQRLDEGYSKQFEGKGMTGPTLEFLEKEVEKILKGK